MKVDIDYLATIFNVFIESEKAHLSILDLKEAGVDIDSPPPSDLINEKFLFHMQIALDNCLISNLQRNANDLKSIGIHIGLGEHSVSCVPLRLTQTGHDFTNALGNSEVLEKIKKEFKDAPFKTIFEGSQKLLQHIMKKKMDSLLAE